ncbi:FliM/FliN family flagellar motor C-terminal domain-containing protein [Ruegeria marina]|uniref:Type III flagellar switch regulator (C-ring) FliN C-term n=1 Tax=Ruegeria marina TaxID=639004 RepID=A0A1G6S2P5_9RHOB|nr:FliM/FliN family flagellar motor C-terminal domain-containing protein [Ruegeria marina]SDD10934.1 Type III flagellar switch regulator (C-ring) FliN C-term [Ruegeria marina]
MVTQSDTRSTLERKLALSRDERQGDTRSVLRALRLALARAADDAVGLAMSVIGATQARRELDELGRAVPEGRLYLLLSGPGDGLGAICLDRSCVTAMVQQQTLGQVIGQVGPERAFTSTDAAMAAPIVDVLMPRAAELAELAADRICLSGYAYCSWAENRRAVLLLLEDDTYRVFDLTVEIAGGKAQGQITLVLPDRPEAVEEVDGGQSSAGPRMEDTFGVVRAELNAVISRIRLPLSSFAGMQPGDLLPLETPKFDKTEMLTIEGRSVAYARLGQCRGMRAVRLNEKPPGPQSLSNGPNDFTIHTSSPQRTMQDLPDPDVIEHAAKPERSRTVHPDDYEDIDTDTEDGFADLAEYDIPLPTLNPEQAAAEITELAGLDDADDLADPR